MPGRPKATYYAEMRNVADGVSGGMARLKMELVPGLATWLIMISKYYQRAAEGMEQRAVITQVPGAKEGAERMRFACEHLQWLLDGIGRQFNRRDWEAAAVEVCAMLQIKPEEMPLFDISDDTFTNAIKGVTCAPDQRREGSDLEPGVQHPEEPPDAGVQPPARRRGQRRKPDLR